MAGATAGDLEQSMAGATAGDAMPSERRSSSVREPTDLTEFRGVGDVFVLLQEVLQAVLQL